MFSCDRLTNFTILSTDRLTNFTIFFILPRPNEKFYDFFPMTVWWNSRFFFFFSDWSKNFAKFSRSLTEEFQNTFSWIGFFSWLVEKICEFYSRNRLAKFMIFSESNQWISWFNLMTDRLILWHSSLHRLWKFTIFSYAQ